MGKQKNLINVTAFFNKRHRDFHEIRGITLPVKSINNVHRSFVGTERAPLQSMPPSSSCFKVSIQNKKQNLHSLPFVCIATAFSKYHSGKHALSYVPLLSWISAHNKATVACKTGLFCHIFNVLQDDVRIIE